MPTASMTRPSTRSQDSAPPSTNENPSSKVHLDVTSAAMANPLAAPCKNTTSRPQSQSVSETLDHQSARIEEPIAAQIQLSQSSLDRNANEDVSSPFFLNLDDHPSLVLVSTIFNGANYQSWKCIITMALIAKNKIAFIDGSLPRPDVGNHLLNS
ncbi:hypothetical protein CsatA_010179 [Cannabis sativa]